MTDQVLELFHPAVQTWFRSAFAAPTPPQVAAWPAIKSGRHALVAAPTGSGKTLAAFLGAIDALVRAGIARGLPDETHVVYVSPLKALSNDVQRNLEAPLAGIRDALAAHGLPDVAIRTLVRTGDTPQADRQSMRKRPPHVVVTTPESLYILLTSESGRRMLATTRTVIVDEIHALAPNKRGAHLALSLERLEALAGPDLVRVGLSATQKPIAEIARFLTGDKACTIVDTGHVKRRDLAIELPSSPLEAVMSGEVWQQVYDRLAALASEHRSTLVFVNTRRLAERVARHLSERLGVDKVAAHHGSLARELRLDAEQRLKLGQLKVLVATASLKLGIDIGDVDLVCQIGATRTIAAFLQRVGRSGHAVGGVPKGRLFPLSRDDLCDAAALLDSARRGELDRIAVPAKPLDVLAQQIVAEVARQEWREEALFERFRRAYPFRDLGRDAFAAVVQMLAEGFHTRRGRRGTRRSHLGRHDPRYRRLRGRPRAAGPHRRLGERGLRDRESRGRRLPAWQHLVPHPPRRARDGTRRGRERRAAGHSVLVRRSAGAERGALAIAVASARDDRDRARSRRARRGQRMARARDRARPSGRRTDRRLPRRRARRPRRVADAQHGGARALLRRIRRHAARRPRAVRRPHQPRLGARAAQALLPAVQLRAAGRGDRGRDRALARDEPQLRARGGRTLSLREDGATAACPGPSRCADVRHPLAVERCGRAGAPALPRRPQGAAAAPADRSRGPARDGLPRPARVRREPRRRARDPRSPARQSDNRRLSARGDGRGGSRARPDGDRARRDPRARPRSNRALAARPRDPVCAALCLPRRRPAGRAAHPGRHGAALARPRDCGRSRQARPGCDPARARRGLAGTAQRRRARRHAHEPCVPHRRRDQAGMASVRGRTCGGPPCGAALARYACDSRRGGASARVWCRAPGCDADTRHRGAGGVPQGLDPRGGARRDRSRPVAGARPRDRCGARRAAGVGSGRDRGNPREARS